MRCKGGKESHEVNGFIKSCNIRKFLSGGIYLAILLSFQWLSAQEYISEPVIIGYRDFNYNGGSVTSEPTEEKPESKLWYNDGLWWGVLWDPVAEKYRIHRFDPSTQNWTNVGPDVDERPRSSADVLWDGTKLYIASHAKLTHKASQGPESARVNHYTYDSGSQSYSLDTGFPVTVNDQKSRDLVIDKDSTGQLWVTWVQQSGGNGQVMVNRTTGSDTTWGVPFVLPVQGVNVSDLDNSAVLPFGGDKMGLFWSNQADGKLYFAIHLDSDADDVWQPSEEAFADPNNPKLADDHLNLAASSDGSVLVAIKRGSGGTNKPLTEVLKRDPTTGVW